MRTVDSDFVPHSLHSYFVAAGDDSLVCEYKVEKVSTGNNFANRLVKLYQKDQLKYLVMISLTKKNSIDKTAQAFDKTGKGPRPFEYQLPVKSSAFKHNLDEIPLLSSDPDKLVQHKLTPEFVDIDEADELSKAPSERTLGFYIRLNDQELPTQYKYATMGVVTDSLYLTSISRILHLPRINNNPLGSSGGANHNFFSISLDHSIYFHDDDFSPTNWLYFQYQSPRFSNNRVLFTGGYYNSKGKLIATIVQEGLVFFKNDADLKAKL
ncbi:acyl-CoA thioesterase II [Yamadazyma tenuis]|nr:acyl-CoA thioesterase II [Yamadazyma tenuis]